MTQEEKLADVAVGRINERMGCSFGPNVNDIVGQEIQNILVIALRDQLQRQALEMKRNMDNTSELELFLANKLLEELARADKIHGPLCCAYHGLNVIEEEFDEFKEEFREKEVNPENLEKEVIQLGAMSIKFLRDVLHGPEKVISEEISDEESNPAG
jgi:predicted nuclease with TOPRIM domain